MAVQSPMTTPRRAEKASGCSGDPATNGFGGKEDVASSVARKKMEATVFFARFSEKALPPRQWSAQIMKPSAEAAGDASAAPKPGNAIAPPAPPRVDSRRAGEEVRGKDMRARAAPRAPWRIATDAVVDSISLTWGSCEFNLRLLVLLGRVPDTELGTMRERCS